MEAGNSPQMILKHYRELVRPKGAKEWFAITPASVEKQKGERGKQKSGPTEAAAAVPGVKATA